MLGIRTHRVLVPALVLFCSAAACRKNPAEQSAAAQTPATGQQAVTPPAPPKPVPAQLPEVIARVNGEDVKKADFDRIIQTMEARAGQPIPADRRDEILRGAIDQLIVYTCCRRRPRTAESRSTRPNRAKMGR